MADPGAVLGGSSSGIKVMPLRRALEPVHGRDTHKVRALGLRKGFHLSRQIGHNKPHPSGGSPVEE